MLEATTDWHRFHPDRLHVVKRSRFTKSYAGQTIMITGAAGDIGSALVDALGPEQVRCLILLDAAEHGLFELQRHIERKYASARCHLVLGSISDEHLIDSVLTRFRPDFVFHAAAFKHVAILEHNVRAAIENNALGTYKLMGAAANCGVKTFVFLSTDKAVRPSSVLGASKRLAEQFVLAQSCEEIHSSVIRLVNVIGSRGSVVPIFMEQLRRNEPLRITDRNARRYFLTKQETADAILEAGLFSGEGKILVPDPGQEIPIIELANFLAQIQSPDRPPSFRFTALHEGEKLCEELHADDERQIESSLQLLRIFERPRWSSGQAVATAANLSSALNNGRYAAKLLTQLLPTYVPSPTVLAQTNLAEGADR